MTVIATDGKTIAFDTLTCADGVAVGKMDKVVELRGGLYAGGSGNAEDVEAFIQWQRECQIAGRVEKPRVDKLNGVLVDLNKGECWSYEAKLFPLKVKFPYAIGFGGGIALGAMLAGKTPLEAVQIAAQACPEIGGELKQLPANYSYAGENRAIEYDSAGFQVMTDNDGHKVLWKQTSCVEVKPGIYEIKGQWSERTGPNVNVTLTPDVPPAPRSGAYAITAGDVMGIGAAIDTLTMIIENASHATTDSDEEVVAIQLTLDQYRHTKAARETLGAILKPDRPDAGRADRHQQGASGS